MSRIQLALNVPEIDDAVVFYSRLFATEPTKRRPGYANFAIEDPPLKLVLFDAPEATERLNHLGVEVTEPGQVRTHQARLQAAEIEATEECGVCCYAEQTKVWVDAPDGAWEIYAVTGDSDTFGEPSSVLSDANVSGAEADDVCCAPAAS